MAASQDGGQILFRGRFNIKVRRPADPQGSVFGQRFIAANHGGLRDSLREFTCGLRPTVASVLQNGSGLAQTPLPAGSGALVTVGRPVRKRPARGGPGGLVLSSGSTVTEPSAAAARRSAWKPSPTPAPRAASMASAICSAACGACHCASALCIFSCTAGFSTRSESICTSSSGVAVSLLQQPGGAGGFKGARIVKLMIVAGCRIRNEHSRHAHGREFSERGCPRATDGGGRRTQRQIHLGEKRMHDRLQLQRRVGLNQLLGSRRSRSDGSHCASGSAAGEQRQRLQHQLVDRRWHPGCRPSRAEQGEPDQGPAQPGKLLPRGPENTRAPACR